MSMFQLFEAKFQMCMLVIAATFDLLAGGFACYISEDPIIPFIVYTLDIVALYTGRLWIPFAFVSFALSVYGVIALRGEPIFLLIFSAFLKCTAFFIKGKIILKSKIHGLIHIMKYVRKNPQVFFVIPFMATLVLAAVKLVFGDVAMADKLAVYAYYQLVGAVIVALVTLRGGESTRTKHRRPG